MTPNSPLQHQGTKGFRLALRDATREDHEATERAFGDLLDAPHRHLPQFLRAQWLAFDALDRSIAAHPSPFLSDVLAALSADGAAGGALPPARPLDPLAVAYVTAGSRLGAAVLRRRLTEAGVDPMPAFFAAGKAESGWHEICAALDAIPQESPRAEQLVADVRHAYRCFEDAATTARQEGTRAYG